MKRFLEEFGLPFKMKRHFSLIGGPIKKTKNIWIQICTLMKRILKINVYLKSELFVLESMDKKLEKNPWNINSVYSNLTTDYCGEITHAKRWKDSALLTVEEWLVKLTELAEIDKLTSLIREKAISAISIGDRKPLLESLYKNKSNELVIYGSDV